MFKTPIAALLTVVMLPSVPFAASNSDQVELTIDKIGGITIPVTVNGHGPFVFMLDTGSTRSAVSSELAARVELPLVAKAVIVTSTGSQVQPVVRLDSISIGTAGRTSLLASVIPGLQLRAPGAGVEGIIGQDFLSAFNYTIDYRKKRMSWAAAVASDDHDRRLPLVKHEGRFLVELQQGDRTLQFVPDSGATNFVIFERNGVAPVALAQISERAELVTLTGTQDMRVMMLRRLLVGSTTFENQVALVVPRNDPDAPAGDGLLPLHMFASVSFNCAEAYIVMRK